MAILLRTFEKIYMRVYDNNVARYLVAGNPRSGTTAIHIAIEGHPNATALYDELKVRPLFSDGLQAFTIGNNPSLDDEKNKAYNVLFDAIAAIHADESQNQIKAIGAKCCFISPDDAEIFASAINNYFKNLKVIHIFREDLVAQYASLVKAQQAKSWHSFSSNNTIPRQKTVKINKWRFINYALSSLKTRRIMDDFKNNHNVLEIKYEDFLKSSEVIYKKIFEFLNLQSIDVTWNHAKKVSPSPEEYIVNYKEMNQVFYKIKEQYCTGNNSFQLKVTLPIMLSILNVKGKVSNKVKRIIRLIGK